MSKVKKNTQNKQNKQNTTKQNKTHETNKQNNKPFVRGLRAETRLTAYRSRYIGLGPVERANVTFTKKCISLIIKVCRSCLRITQGQILHTLKLQLELLNVQHDRRNEKLHPVAIFQNMKKIKIKNEIFNKYLNLSIKVV